MKTLGYRLAEARKNFGLTQKEVAEKLLLTTQAIKAWENGHSLPDTEQIPELASLYGVTTDWPVPAVTAHNSMKAMDDH